ncbi:MAG: TrbI/VirB10 family protein [Alphaproteobacteria bacterium]|nr:TrbI/VirB10 family protein [Alphaproteobacteria bacterium]
MTDNNHDDFEHHDIEAHEEPAPRRDLRANLTEAWRTRPFFKLLVLMTVVGAVFAAGASFFSGGPGPTPQASLVQPPNIREAPGGKASPYFLQQTQAADEQRTKTALESGQSAFPTPIGQAGNLGELTEKKDNQLNELRAETQYLKQQMAQIAATRQQQAQVAQPKPFDEGLATAMQGQMKQVMDSWQPRSMKHVSGVKDEKPKSETSGVPSSASGLAATPASSVTEPKTIVPAGTVSYAELLVEANSDVPGPIMAHIVSGPLSGARAIGQFQIANGYSDYLVLQFNLANLKGKDYPINAIALDPDTTLAGMATEVDQRYFTRVVLPAAASFLQAFGSALGQTSSSVVTNGQTTIVAQGGQGLERGLYRGLGQAGQTASQFFQNQANQVRPLVRVAAGTPMGIFFVTSVKENTLSGTEQPAAATAAGFGPGYPGMPGARTGAFPQAGGTSPYGTPYGASAGYPGSTGPYSPYTVTGFGGGGMSPYSPYNNMGMMGPGSYGTQGLVPGMYGR